MNKIISLILALTLTACATVMPDRTVSVTGDQIAQKLNEKLAIPISLLKVFDVNLSNATVSFDQETGRMTTMMDTKLSSELFGESFVGDIGISGKLRFDAAKNAIVLDEPAIEQFNLDGASEKHNDLLNALAKTVGGEMLNGLTLYQVKPEDLQFAGTQYSPKEMVVTNQGLQLTLTPK